MAGICATKILQREAELRAKRATVSVATDRLLPMLTNRLDALRGPSFCNYFE